VQWATAAGAEMLVFPGVLHRPLSKGIKVRPTLSWRSVRISYKLVGTKRACALHDRIVARRLRRIAGQIDVVHVWPMGALETLKTAASLGIPTVLERPNAHTRFAYKVVQQECQRLGVPLPTDHEHAYKADWLRVEEEEYRLASRILCPSDFVAQTFLESGSPSEKLSRHQYGFDETMFHAPVNGHSLKRPFTMLFVGGCAPRKGLHYALEAWLKSTASRDGTFLIVGEFVPGYREKLSSMLSHPSVQVMGFRRDIADLMRHSDVLVLPTIEEGSALVTSEARGCGCVLLVSEAAGAICRHGENALLHSPTDAVTLAEQITTLHQDRALLERLRTASLATVQEITWAAAGRKLAAVYRETAALRRPA
jgi:glycosyltransferase involved in cell wall biosynthesis